jgi:hypothetical protein
VSERVAEENINQSNDDKVRRIPLREALRRIHVRKRMSTWGLRLIFGVVLLVMSEIVMWNNPLTHSAGTWAVLVVIYTALAAIFIDLVVRLQARDIAALLLASGVYGLVASTIVTQNVFNNLPLNLLTRGLGLQTGAGFYGLLLFITVMRGRPPNGLQLLAGVAVGVLWGIWIHWYPLQDGVEWGLVPLETAQIVAVIGLVVIGALLFLVAPRFKVVREQELELQWWEAILAGVPLFLALFIGMLQNTIPFLLLIPMAALGAFIVWALNYIRKEYEPSIFGEITITAPNFMTYVAYAVVFLSAGTLAYQTVTDRDSPIGVIAYVIVFAFGSAWLPGACLWIFWQEYRERTAKQRARRKRMENRNG